MNTPRLRISLGWLLMLFTLIALTVSHINTSRRLAATHAELMSYRYQYGHLVVDDPQRTHLLAYAKQENPWKWHAYFPKGKNYRLMCGVGSVPLSGVPDVTQLQHVQATWIVGSEQTKTLSVSLTESSNGSLNFSIGCDGSQSVSQIFPKSDIYQRSAFNSFRVGQREAFAVDRDQPFVIFYQTERMANAAGVSPSSEKGVVVWVAPEP